MSTREQTDAALVASLAAEIASLRAYRGMTQEEVWTRAGLSKSAYIKIENGKSGVTRNIEQISNIAYALGTTAGELIRRAEVGAPNFLADVVTGITDTERDDLKQAIERHQPKRPNPNGSSSARSQTGS